jgi:hypothetical protein
MGCASRGAAGKKKPRMRGALIFLRRLERPGGSLSAPSEQRRGPVSVSAIGTLRHHEHLNFPAETPGAFGHSGLYLEARVFMHAPYRS